MQNLELNKGQLSLGAAMRKRIRMEVESLAFKAEQDRLNGEKIRKLGELY